ncbi:MAG: hypothetical protein Q9220_001418 [cf. Caloplaca sp. 1 TL-2023]
MAPSRIISISVLLASGVAGFLYLSLQSGPRFWTSFGKQTHVVEPSHITSTAHRFTPEVLLSAPRRSPAVPDPSGKLALYTVSTYSFESHEKTSEIRVLNIANGQSTLISNDRKASDPVWLEDATELLWFQEGNKGATELVVSSVEEIGKSYVAGIVPGSISDPKVKLLRPGRTAIGVTGKSSRNGTLYNAECEPKKYTSARLYDSTMVRHWDEYVAPQKNAIWYGVLEKSAGEWSLGSLTNALKDTGLESPMPTFGGKDHYDISSTGLVFVAKDPDLNPAFNTKCNFYYVPIQDFSREPAVRPQKFDISILQGAATSPVFSPDGKSAAFLQMKKNGYESDQNHIVHIPRLSSLQEDTDDSINSASVITLAGPEATWDRSPSSVIFNPDGTLLLFVIEDKGDDVLFKIDLVDSSATTPQHPHALTGSGVISDVQPLRADSGELFISSSNLIDNSIYTIIDPAKPSDSRIVSSNSRNGLSFGLSSNQVSEIWFQGAGDYQVHALVMKPSDFSEDKKYPLAYMIHGGPQGAWTRSWSTRWNPAVFAEQGYVVICPNPTGSTGYGQAFVDAITGSWGGLPYEDLVKGFEFIKGLPYVDTDNAVALGASYGGYMMNWMQGHPLGRAFKALVCHDGVFSMVNQISSDEQYFPNHDLGGPYWKAQETWEKWNPARFTGNWSTPMLVIHNEMDYRLPISEGLAMFNVLQERGIESRFLTFADENHWVLKEENGLVWHTVVLNWINKFVGLPPYKDEEELRRMGMAGEQAPAAG